VFPAVNSGPSLQMMGS